LKPALFSIFLQDFGGATYALRQSELTSQLQELNKVLLAKQELAEKVSTAGMSMKLFLVRC
jgi:hypothetical protein